MSEFDLLNRSRAMRHAHDLDSIVECAVEDQIAPHHPCAGIVCNFGPYPPKTGTARKELALRLDPVELAIGGSRIVPRDELLDLDKIGLRPGTLRAGRHRGSARSVPLLRKPRSRLRLHLGEVEGRCGAALDPVPSPARAEGAGVI